MASALGRGFTVATRVAVASAVVLVGLPVGPLGLHAVLLLPDLKVALVLAVALVVRVTAAARARVALTTVRVVLALVRRFRARLGCSRSAGWRSVVIRNLINCLLFTVLFLFFFYFT